MKKRFALKLEVVDMVPPLNAATRDGKPAGAMAPAAKTAAPVAKK